MKNNHLLSSKVMPSKISNQSKKWWLQDNLANIRIISKNWTHFMHHWSKVDQIFQINKWFSLISLKKQQFKGLNSLLNLSINHLKTKKLYGNKKRLICKEKLNNLKLSSLTKLQWKNNISISWTKKIQNYLDH